MPQVHVDRRRYKTQWLALGQAHANVERNLNHPFPAFEYLII